jgi:hypothetical protein
MDFQSRPRNPVRLHFVAVAELPGRPHLKRNRKLHHTERPALGQSLLPALPQTQASPNPSRKNNV